MSGVRKQGGKSWDKGRVIRLPRGMDKQGTLLLPFAINAGIKQETVGGTTSLKGVFQLEAQALRTQPLRQVSPSSMGRVITWRVMAAGDV